MTDSPTPDAKLPELPDPAWFAGPDVFVNPLAEPTPFFTVRQMRAYALAALSAAGWREGWVSVPREATEAMRVALRSDPKVPWRGTCYGDTQEAYDRRFADALYAAMLAAAPHLPDAGVGEEVRRETWAVFGSLILAAGGHIRTTRRHMTEAGLREVTRTENPDGSVDWHVAALRPEQGEGEGAT